MDPQNLYERDFYAWTQQQAQFLRERAWEKLDLPHLIEEMESLGRQQRQELRNRLGVLVGHLLQWEYQPQARYRCSGRKFWIYAPEENVPPSGGSLEIGNL